MTQSVRASAAEAVADTLLGLVISILSYLLVLPFLGFQCTLALSLSLTLYFTLLSLAGRYLTRRFFERLEREEPE